MLADRVVDRDVLDDDRVRLAPRGVGALCRGQRRHGVTDAVERPAQVDGRRPRGVQHGVRACRARRSDASRSSAMREAVGADGTDQRRAADPHAADGERGGVRVRRSTARTGVRKHPLVEHLDVARAAADGRAPGTVRDRRDAAARCIGRGSTPRCYFSTWTRLLKSSVHSRQSGRGSIGTAPRRGADARAVAGSRTTSTQSLRLASAPSPSSATCDRREARAPAPAPRPPGSGRGSGWSRGRRSCRRA